MTWARVRVGFSLDEACAEFQDIGLREKGEAFPTYPQLAKLAKKFQALVAVFFFPEPPDIEPIRNSFRTLPNQQFSLIPLDVNAMLRKARVRSNGIGMVK